MNRSVTGVTLFEDDGDYDAFEGVLAEACERYPRMRLCAYCIMPNHFHLVLWPRDDGMLSPFMQWLTMTHTQRWRVYRDTVGLGHLYQGRFKSFPIELDRHFLTVCRYVERNALRAGLVKRVEDWRWSSLAARAATLGGQWPIDRPRNWAAHVNRAQTQAELEAIRRSVKRGTPYGGDAWVHKAAAAMGLDGALRPRGRPRKSRA